MTGVWIGHIIAGILGVLLSLSITFQRLEVAFSVHRKLNGQDIEEIIDEAGQALPTNERGSFLAHYNHLIYMGKKRAYGVNYDRGTTVYLRSGERIQVVMGEKFYEVKRTKKNGKVVYFELLDKPRMTDPI